MLKVLLLVLACRCRDRGAEEEPERVIPPAYVPPDTPGPWDAGAAQRVVMGPEGAELGVWIWFPTAEPGLQPASYDGMGEGEATVDALPDCEEARPVAVFSHASGGLAAQSWFLAERLATQGWVVVAPTHAGNSRGDNDLTDLAGSVLRRPAELSAAYDGLLAESASEGEPLAGCVDPDAGFAVVGHDLGGSSALMLAGASVRGEALKPLCQDGDSLACALIDLGLDGDEEAELSLADDRVFGAFALAPTGVALSVGGLEDVFAPVGILGATQDATVSWDEVLDPTFDALTVSPRGLGGVPGAGHLSFTALCPFYTGWPECEEVSGYLSVEESWEAVNVTAVPVLEVFRGEDRALLYLPPDRAEVTWSWK